VERLSVEKRFGLGRFQGSEANICQADARARARARSRERDLRGNARGRVIADLSLELQISTPARLRRNRDPYLLEDLVWLKRGCEQGGEEAVNRDFAFATRPYRDHRSSQRNHRGRMVVRGIAVSEIPAHRRLVSHQGIGNNRSGVDEDWETRSNQYRMFELAFPYQCANAQNTGFFFYVIESGYP